MNLLAFGVKLRFNNIIWFNLHYLLPDSINIQHVEHLEGAISNSFSLLLMLKNNRLSGTPVFMLANPQKMKQSSVRSHLRSDRPCLASALVDVCANPCSYGPQTFKPIHHANPLWIPAQITGHLLVWL